MSDDLESNLYQQNEIIHEGFAKKRIQEVKTQKTFGTPDHELVKPAMEEIRKGEARAFIVAVETKSGIKFAHRSKGSDKLMAMLEGME